MTSSSCVDGADGRCQDWLQSLLSGNYSMGCWHCGSECRSSDKHRLAETTCECAGEVRKAAPCPARYCGAECLQQDWKARHHLICKPLYIAMSNVSLESCENGMASDISVIIPYLMRVQACIYVIEADCNDGLADILRLSPHLQIMKCLSSILQASVGAPLSNSVDEQTVIWEHARYLRDRLVLCHVESIVCVLEEEGPDPIQWDTNSQRDALQVTLVVKQFQLPATVAPPFDVVPGFMDITNDVILGQRGRALAKLKSLHSSCEQFKAKGGLWISASEETADKASAALTLGAQFSHIAARLAHALGSSLTQQVLADGNRRTMELGESINLFDIFAWQPGIMSARGASAALQALEVADSWMRLALFSDIQLWTCSACNESQTVMLSTIAQCGLYVARHALARFVSSFDVLGFGSIVFGHSMALDLLYQAKCGFSDLKLQLKNLEWIAATFDGFVSILQQIAKVINRRQIGSRWYFIFHVRGEQPQVVYIDDEANPLVRMGQVAVVVLDANGREHLEHESRQGAQVSSTQCGVQLSRKYVEVQHISPFIGQLDQVDADGNIQNAVIHKFNTTPGTLMHETKSARAMELCLGGLD